MSDAHYWSEMVLTFYTDKPEIPVGKPNGSSHCIWKLWDTGWFILVSPVDVGRWRLPFPSRVRSNLIF